MPFLSVQFTFIHFLEHVDTRCCERSYKGYEKLSYTSHYSNNRITGQKLVQKFLRESYWERGWPGCRMSPDSAISVPWCWGEVGLLSACPSWSVLVHKEANSRTGIETEQLGPRQSTPLPSLHTMNAPGWATQGSVTINWRESGLLANLVQLGLEKNSTIRLSFPLLWGTGMKSDGKWERVHTSRWSESKYRGWPPLPQDDLQSSQAKTKALDSHYRDTAECVKCCK